MGVLNDSYNFFYNWLFSSAPVAPLSALAEPIAVCFSVSLVAIAVGFAYKLVTRVISFIMSLGRR